MKVTILGLTRQKDKQWTEGRGRIAAAGGRVSLSSTYFQQVEEASTLVITSDL